MGLGNAKFNEIMRAYDETRSKNEYKRKARYEEICERFPEYKKLDEQVPITASSALNKLLEGDMIGSMKAREHLKEIANRKKEILEENGY